MLTPWGIEGNFALWTLWVAFSYASEEEMTLWEVYTLYYTELFPVTNSDINSVVLKINGIGDRATLRSAMQRAVYYDMIPNDTYEIRPDREIKDRSFVKILEKHFGIKVFTDNSRLSLEDYNGYMDLVRSTYAYRVIHEMNTAISKDQTEIPNASHLEWAEGFYILDSVYSIIRSNHLRSDTIAEQELIYGATEWLVDEIGDPYTKFFRPEASIDFYQSLEGKIVWIGIIVDVDATGGLSITDVIDHSPAEKSGIQSGDFITHIDGKAVDTDDGITQEIKLIRGKENTTVELTIISGYKTRTITVTRKVIQVPIVETSYSADAVLIKYSQVDFGTDALFQKALQEFLESGRKRLIIDLRNNPGGSLSETRNILNDFIAKWQPLFSLKYPTRTYTNIATEEPIADWSQYEIIILINHDTASAAEVIATALREHFPKTVAILWEVSYGKGTVQELIPFEDKSLLKYTIAEWFTPLKIVSINTVGIIPDKKVRFNKRIWKKKKIDSQVVAAEKYVFVK